MVYLYNENMWDHLRSFQTQSIQLSLHQYCTAKRPKVFSVCPLPKSASRFSISGKRETTQHCYMHIGNTPFPFKQRLGSNPTRLNLISSCIFYHCFASVISCQLITIIFMPSQLPPKHPSSDHLGNVHQIVLVTLWSIIKCNVWRFVYCFIFEDIYFLIVKDAMRNTAVHYMYTFPPLF